MIQSYESPSRLSPIPVSPARRAIVGASAALQEVMELVDLVAGSDATVLISGETGTGKELIARAVHERSLRSSRSFVAVNCGGLPAALLSSELFGHEKGAFTGALQRRIGRFEQAAGGTLFLDEIGELPMDMQVTLLRVLQEREFERLGGAQPIRSNVRTVAATNRRLEDEVAAGRFRADLFYRLNVFPIAVPSLRDRKEDLPHLVRHFVEQGARMSGKAVRALSEESMALLLRHSWPGNVRELENVVQRAVLLARGDVATVDERWLSPHATVSEEPLSVGDARDLTFTARINERERQMIEAALAETRGRVSGPFGAAAILRVPPSTLESKIRSLGVDKHRFKPGRRDALGGSA